MKFKMFGKARNILVSVMEWREAHPKGVVCESDAYYAKFAGRIAGLLKVMIGKGGDCTENDLKAIAIDIVAYFEDKLNGINLYNAFLAAYRKRFGRSCPFYDADAADLLDDEPNREDIRFLLWQRINYMNPDTILNPISPVIGEMAEEICTILYDEFEVAPESPELYDAIYSPENFRDLIKLRQLCEWIAVRAYLTAVWDTESCFEEIYRIYTSYMDDRDGASSNMLLYGIDAYFSFNVKCGPLALTPQKWLGKMLELSEDKELREFAPVLEAMSTYTIMPYEITSVGNDGFEVVNLAGETMQMKFDPLPEATWKDVRKGHILVGALVEFEGFWRVNGLSKFTPQPESLSEEIKLYLDKKKELAETYRIQVEKNGGSQIGVAGDWKELVSRFDLDKANDTSVDGSIKENMKEEKNLLYFINTNSSMSLLPGRATGIAIPDNPYYDKHEAERLSGVILLDNDSTEELRDYLINNNLLPDARLAGPYPDDKAKKWFAANAPFLAILTHTDEVEFNLP